MCIDMEVKIRHDDKLADSEHVFVQTVSACHNGAKTRVDAAGTMEVHDVVKSQDGSAFDNVGATKPSTSTIVLSDSNETAIHDIASDELYVTADGLAVEEMSLAFALPAFYFKSCASVDGNNSSILAAFRRRRCTHLNGDLSQSDGPLCPDPFEMEAVCWNDHDLASHSFDILAILTRDPKSTEYAPRSDWLDEGQAERETSHLFNESGAGGAHLLKAKVYTLTEALYIMGHRDTDETINPVGEVSPASGQVGLQADPPKLFTGETGHTTFLASHSLGEEGASPHNRTSRATADALADAALAAVGRAVDQWLWPHFCKLGKCSSGIGRLWEHSGSHVLVGYYGITVDNPCTSINVRPSVKTSIIKARGDTKGELEVELEMNPAEGARHAFGAEVIARGWHKMCFGYIFGEYCYRKKEVKAVVNIDLTPSVKLLFGYELTASGLEIHFRTPEVELECSSSVSTSSSSYGGFVTTFIPFVNVISAVFNFVLELGLTATRLAQKMDLACKKIKSSGTPMLTTAVASGINGLLDWADGEQLKRLRCDDYKPLSASKWYDSDGPRYDCEWYSHGSRCASYGNAYRNFGQTANTACCGCKASGPVASAGFAVAGWHKDLAIDWTAAIPPLKAKCVVQDVVLAQRRSSCPAGYVIADGCCDNGDVNDGAGGKFIYICMKKGFDLSEPVVTELAIRQNRGWSGYSYIGGRDGLNGDLNEGAGGKYIYLFQRKAMPSPSGWTAIENIVLSDNRSRCPSGYRRIRNGPGLNGDLNQGAGGAYIYMCVKYVSY